MNHHVDNRGRHEEAVEIFYGCQLTVLEGGQSDVLWPEVDFRSYTAQVARIVTHVDKGISESTPSLVNDF